MAEPRYQEFPSENIPVVQPAEGVGVKVIAGVVGDARGPISQPATDPLYLDIGLEAGRSWEYVLPEGHNAFAYVFEGEAVLGDGDDARKLGTHEMAVLGGGDVFKATASSDARLILVAGRPLREPVVRYGPFVMNTKQEIMQAFVDFQEGRF
jgi:redox-sensitive bicupin YhaK (pirin superfamily)